VCIFHTLQEAIDDASKEAIIRMNVPEHTLSRYRTITREFYHSDPMQVHAWKLHHENQLIICGRIALTTQWSYKGHFISHTHAHKHTHIHTYVHSYTQMQVYIHSYMHMHMHTYMHTHVHIYKIGIHSDTACIIISYYWSAY